MTRFRWLLVLVVVVTSVFAVRFAISFPWSGTFDAIVSADWLLLMVGCVANLVSLGAKGWSWHLLLRPAAPHRWRTAQVATFVGAAVNSVSVAVSGEAARVQVAAMRDGVPLGTGIWAAVWSRVVEALALVIFVAVAVTLLPGEQPWLRPVRVGGWAALAAVVALWALGVLPWLVARLPAGWRPQLQGPTGPLEPRRLAAPLALALLNWGAQWLSYHCVIAGTHVSTSAAVSLTALVLANLGGAIRLTPGNLGVFQALVVLGMEAFDLPADRALAAGLVLQAVQVLPVITIGLALVGAHGLRSLVGKRPETVEA